VKTEGWIHVLSAQKTRSKRTRILTGVGPSSKFNPIIPAGASQMSPGIRHEKLFAAHTCASEGFTPGGYVGPPFVSVATGASGILPAAMASLRAVTQAEGMEAWAGVEAG
jgi:hypothetical protein